MTDQRPTMAQLDEMQREYEEKVMPGLQHHAAMNLITQARVVAERHSLGQRATLSVLKRVQEAVNKVVRDWQKEMKKVGDFETPDVYITARFLPRGLDLAVSPAVSLMVEGKSPIKLLMPDAPIMKYADDLLRGYIKPERTEEP